MIFASTLYESNFMIFIAIATAIAVIAINIAFDIAAAFIVFSSLEDIGRVLYFIAIGIMQVRFINIQDINITSNYILKTIAMTLTTFLATLGSPLPSDGLSSQTRTE